MMQDGSRPRIQEQQDDGDMMPPLKFKVPNFIGSLKDRRRPNFANDEDDDSRPTPPSMPTPQQYQESPTPRTVEKAYPDSTSSIRSSVTETPRTESTPTPPMKPINLFMQTRTRDAESKVVHQHEVRQPAAPREIESRPEPAVPTSQVKAMEEPVRLPEPQQFSEADQIISQIFQMLNGLYSIRRRECEGAMQLRAQLDIEHINSSQLRSLLDLERCSKEGIQNELGLSIKSTQALSERISQLQQEIMQHQKERLQLEGQKNQVLKDLTSVTIERDLQKSELESAHQRLQDLESALAGLDGQRCLLEEELCKQRAGFHEQESRLSKELTIAHQKCQELQETLVQEKKSQTQALEALNVRLASSDERMAQFQLEIGQMAKVLGLDEGSSPADLRKSIEEMIMEQGAFKTNMERYTAELRKGYEEKHQASLALGKELERYKACEGERQGADAQIIKDLEFGCDVMRQEIQALRKDLEEHEKAKLEHVQAMTDVGNLMKSIGASTIQESLKMIEELKRGRSQEEGVDKKHKEERALWEQEKLRIMTDKLKLIQENEALRKTLQETKNDGVSTPKSGGTETTTDSIMKAIEADLMKSRAAAAGKTPKVPDDSWVVSDGSSKSPMKRAAALRPSSRKKKVTMDNKTVRNSPLQPTSVNNASELDFWAYK